MGNKLKEIFSNEMPRFEGKLSFENQEARKKFAEAGKRCRQTGESEIIEGVTQVNTVMKDGTRTYPLLSRKNITELVISPQKELFPITISTPRGKKTLEFFVYKIEEGIVVENDKNSIVYFKMLIKDDSEEIIYHYNTRPTLANSVSEILESYQDALEFLNYMFQLESEEITITDDERVEKEEARFKLAISFYEKVVEIEKKLQISFNPKIEPSKEDEYFLEEIYALLVKKEAFRLNVKMNKAKSIKMNKKMTESLIGKRIDLTSIGTIKRSVWGETIILYTAQLFANAIIKEMVIEEDGTTKMLYEEDESNPMFLAYTAFQTEEEAIKEMEKMMKHRKKYDNATTVTQYLNEKYSNQN